MEQHEILGWLLLAEPLPVPKNTPPARQHASRRANDSSGCEKYALGSTITTLAFWNLVSRKADRLAIDGIGQQQGLPHWITRVSLVPASVLSSAQQYKI